jgi:hypothetical protein
MRGDRPFLFTDLKHSQGLDAVIDWLITGMKLSERRGLGTLAEPGGLLAGGHSHAHSHDHGSAHSHSH